MKYNVFALCIVLLTAAPISYAGSSADNDTAVVLINPFVVPDGKLDEALAMWELARDFLKDQPGYISTELHQSLSPDAPYRLINVAQWESAALFKAAIARMHASKILPSIEGVKPSPQLYTVVRN